MSKRKQESLIAGIVLLLIGALFMLENIGIDIDVWDLMGTYWPTILIAVGIKSIVLYFRQKNENQEYTEQRQD
jgi:putative Mn2+ efflux pump MntP